MDQPDRSTRDSLLLTGAIWGPVVFLLGWVIGGFLYPGFSPVTGHISTLAAVSAPSRLVMTAGQVALAVGLAAAAIPLRSILGLGAAYCLGIAALSLAVIIATPDGSVPDRGFIHGGFAILLYASLVALGLVAGRRFRGGGVPMAGAVALAIALATAICFWLSLGETASGLFQRLGFTIPSLWLAAIALRRGPCPPR